MERKKLIKFLGFSFFGILFASIFFISDSILLVLFQKRKLISDRVNAQYLQPFNKNFEKDLNSKNYEGKINKLNKFNIGRYIDEGSLLDNTGMSGRHHDSNSQYHVTGESNQDKNIWILGDSWGEGIKRNEKQSKTLENILLNQFTSMRIISSSSWSPLLMNLAFRHYSTIYNETPNKIVIFLDQTDIGDDYCRYRPFVERDQSGNLLKVHTNKYDFYTFLHSWRLHRSLGVEKSGFVSLFKKFIQRTYARLGLEIPGINSCNYFDLLAWQIGEKNSPNGTNTSKYVEYFKSNMTNFINEIKSLNPKVEILLVTHDWDQNQANALNKMKKFKRDYSSLVRLIANDNNVQNLHISTQDYLNNGFNRDKIYLPKDLTSHLIDYSFLSGKIAEKLIGKN